MNPSSWPIWLNVAVFASAAAVVWFAGTRLARYVDAIADRTGLGREVLGLLLLGGVTSLPELAVATTATLQGTPVLSVNDVLGSAAINIVVLAIADAVIGRDALSSMQGSPSVLLQGVLGMVLLGLVIAPVIAGDRIVAGVGVWSWLMLGAYIMGLRLMTRSQAGTAWQVTRKRNRSNESQGGAEGGRSLRKLSWLTVAAGAAILIAGFLLARTGQGLAEQTGLGTSFFGAVFLGFSTSLPEVSTVLAAVRLRRYEMAISDVFGTNLFNVTIIVLVDALHPGGPVLVEAGRFSSFGALMALVFTAFYIVGMLERRDRTVLRMGLDSAAVVLGYIAGVVVLNGLR
jgi:cation:H+ antiporter